jgi:hypothetical protein
MDSLSAHQFLTLYIWFGLSALVFLMALIARFYERLSGQRTYYQFFVVPVTGFAGAAIRMAAFDQVVGDVLADLFLMAGGVSLGVLCLHVYRLMTSGH